MEGVRGSIPLSSTPQAAPDERKPGGRLLSGSRFTTRRIASRARHRGVTTLKAKRPEAIGGSASFPVSVWGGHHVVGNSYHASRQVRCVNRDLFGYGPVEVSAQLGADHDHCWAHPLTDRRVGRLGDSLDDRGRFVGCWRSAVASRRGRSTARRSTPLLVAGPTASNGSANPQTATRSGPPGFRGGPGFVSWRPWERPEGGEPTNILVSASNAKRPLVL